MNPVFCIGSFTTPVMTHKSLNIPLHGLREAVFHRGRHDVHVLCSDYEKVGDLDPIASKAIGSLIGPVGTVSRPLTSKYLEESRKLLYLQLFYVHTPMPKSASVHGFVFTPYQTVNVVREAFESANILLKHIPNYEMRHFFNVPQLEESIHPSLSEHLTVPGCKNMLMDHQVQAVRFIQRSESSSASVIQEIWNHPDNEWVRRVYDDAIQAGHLDRVDSWESKGCILADDMGLGKTLTTLSVIQLSCHDAQEFVQQLPREVNTKRSPATLIICPLGTLDNWKNEINKHFNPGTLPFRTFYGKEKGKIGCRDISSIAVLLATYESILTPSKRRNSNPVAGSSQALMEEEELLDLMDVEWFRIVLDEAHYMKDPKTNRSIGLSVMKAQQRLCLTGTPLQNQLGDLHTLLSFLQIEPWRNPSIWKCCVENPVQLCDPRGIATLQSIMKGISMRRLKTAVLSLPEKFESIIDLELKAPWDKTYAKNHEAFSINFGKNRVSGQGWNSTDFFGELVDLRQLCNHPAMIEKESGRHSYAWNESSKIEHLIGDLKEHMMNGSGRRAVVFSEFKRFLLIIEVALNEEQISYTTHYGKMDNDVRKRNLEHFRTNPDCQVLLATIKTAGVGIDLRCAQSVYIMEPTWNPAIEEQAIDRLYRIGQKENVRVVRYRVKDSIEENIFQIKRKKAELSMLSVPLSGNLEYEVVKKIMSERLVKS